LKLRWSIPARHDIHRISAYYRDIDPALSIHMREQVDAALIKLLELPTIASPSARGTSRKWKARGTPLLIFFVVRRGELIAKRVRHEREDWLSDF